MTRAKQPTGSSSRRSRRSTNAVRTMTPRGVEPELDEEIEARRAQASADRLVVAARYYTMTAWRVTRALSPIAEERGDPSVIAAVETIAALWPAGREQDVSRGLSERPTRTSIASISRATPMAPPRSRA